MWQLIDGVVVVVVGSARKGMREPVRVSRRAVAITASAVVVFVFDGRRGDDDTRRGFAQLLTRPIFRLAGGEPLVNQALRVGFIAPRYLVLELEDLDGRPLIVRHPDGRFAFKSGCGRRRCRSIKQS